MLDQTAAERRATDVVQELRTVLQVDDKWASSLDGGFSWWPHWFRQSAWAEPAKSSHDMFIARVVVETEVLHGLAARDSAARASKLIARPGAGDDVHFLSGSWNNVAQLPLRPGLSGAVMHQSELRLRSSVFVHGETDQWMRRLLQVAAVEQLEIAESQAAVLAASLNGTLAATEHPSSGRRGVADEIVGAMPAMVSGQVDSAWRNPEELTRTAEFLTGHGYVSTTDEGKSKFRGLTAEVPSGPELGYAIRGGTSHLIMATTEHPHPTLGAGLLVRRLLREAPRTSAGVAINAVDLNGLEATTGTTQVFGSWSGDADSPQFTTFLPNVLYQPGALQVVCLAMVIRAHWADQLSSQSPPH